MKTVITYGTYDLFHQGHFNLLKHAKELGDYLIVGVTTDSFDKDRGKLNVQNNIMERIEAVRNTGFADKIIIEEYVGQKIDDIQKYNVDIFAIGSDWKGKFDYLNDYCKVVYLPRTKGISSTQLRHSQRSNIRIGIIGTGRIAERFPSEAEFVDYAQVAAVYNPSEDMAYSFAQRHNITLATADFKEFMQHIDAAYIASPHLTHYDYMKELISNGKHVLCEIPFVLSVEQSKHIFELSKQYNVVVLEANKTAFCPAFNHIVSLVKSGIIGTVVDVEASVSTLTAGNLRELDMHQAGGSMTENAALPLMAIFRLMGTNYSNLSFYSRIENGIDIYTKCLMTMKTGVASFKVGLGVKTEGNLVVSGTKGYVYVPAPWWKTDYFEVRYEDVNQNRKFFYSYEGSGLRYEIQEFVYNIVNKRLYSHKLTIKETTSIITVIESYLKNSNVLFI